MISTPETRWSLFFLGYGAPSFGGSDISLGEQWTFMGAFAEGGAVVGQILYGLYRRLFKRRTHGVLKYSEMVEKTSPRRYFR